MRKLDRYIIASVAAAMLLVLLVVLSLDLVFSFIAELEELKNDYQVTEAIMFVVTTLPRRIYDYLPLAAFIGSLIGLGALANNSELTVIRAAGVSTRRIVWSAMKPAIAIVIVGLLLGEYVAPYTEKIAQSQRAVAQGTGESLAAKRGIWHREGDTFMHFNAVEPNGELHGVTLFEYSEDGWLQRSRFAKRAIYQRGEWLLEDVTETNLTSTQTSVVKSHLLKWHTELSPQVLGVLVIKPDNLSISGLYTYSNYLMEQGLSASVYLMSFWKKVLRPLTTAVLVLVAISFVFGPLRSVTMGFRVFTGIIVGLLFKYMQDLLGPSSLVFGFDPIIATLAPIMVSSMLGFYLLRRAR
ncbi:LPS export ABC transporter permease LptG [Alkalimarinus sediminis]|uniref:LPS export ABC transporter permease LptG n=1 Tax=Alkalimarinus sediminis TaxID=1632866 RepID=A0A9E8HP40_9ALTE|nr:LPS export ABC transporter permease LptG [Alkalimarinus sediminis]UZW73274.1 LPS export ABC transporter permease LptG [Alkalimarinus sediminis]